MPGSRSAIAIGSFDGVHRGHQAVLSALVAGARAAGLEAVVVTFEPLPKEYFGGEDAPRRLQSLRDKVGCLRAAGVEVIRCLRFDARLAAESAEDFVARVLVAELGVGQVVMGEDFRFGHGRLGDVALLRTLGARYGYSVVPPQTVSLDGARVSSTRIRALLAEGALEPAAALLGRPYGMSGRVMRGDARGRTLGIPTANLRPKRPLPLAEGVYAVQVAREDGSVHVGAAHWGRRAWLGEASYRLEVHLLGFEGDLYGERLGIEFRRFVRPDRAFGSLEALRRQMEKDIGQISGGL